MSKKEYFDLQHEELRIGGVGSPKDPEPHVSRPAIKENIPQPVSRKKP